MATVLTSRATFEQPDPPRRRPPCGEVGDVNGDGWVSEEDVNLIGQFIVGNQEPTDHQQTVADVNADQEITSGDGSLIRRYFREEIDTFERCPFGSTGPPAVTEEPTEEPPEENGEAPAGDLLGGGMATTFLLIVAVAAVLIFVVAG